MKLNLYVSVIWFLMMSVGISRPQIAQVESAMQQAQQFYQSKQLDRASSLLRKTLDQHPESTDVMQLLAQIEMERQQWGKAKSLYKKLKELQPRDILPRYGLAICYRETGRLKALFLRMIDWRKSRQYFEQVIARDRSFRDVLLQYAILQRYRGQYFSAVDLNEKELVYNPAAPRATVELFRHFDLLLVHEPAATVELWLKQRNNAGAQYMLAELARRQGKWQQADSLLQSLLQKNNLEISKIPILLSLVRLSVQKENDLAATRYFQAALDSMENMTDMDLLFEDLHYIFSDADLDYFNRMKTLNGKKRFIEIYWIQRNPLPAADVNIRLAEHFRRLIYAEEHYRFDGFRLEFNNPDKLHYLTFPKVFDLNQKFNDKGLVYIRHGKPHERVFSMGSNVVQNETWVYYGDGQHKKMMFHFFIDKNATGNNWRLGTEITPEMLESRLTIDPIFQQMYMADQMERLRYENEIATKAKEDVAIGLNSERHTWDEEVRPIEFPYTLTAFRGSGQKTQYDAALAVPFKNVWSAKKEYKPEQVLDFGIAVFDPQWKEIFKKSWQRRAEEIKTMSDSLGAFIEQHSFETNASLMYVGLFVTLSAQHKVGGYRFNYHGKAYDRSRFAMSDIVLSKRVAPGNEKDPFFKHGLIVQPNPSGEFSKKEPLYVYFELYNLPAPEGASVNFTLQYNLKLLEKQESNIFSQLTKLFTRESEETSNLVQRFAQQEMSVEYLALDLSKKTSGRYRLEVVAHIPVTDQRVSGKVEFELR